MKTRLHILLTTLLICGILQCVQATPSCAETAEQIFDRAAKQFREALALSQPQQKMDAFQKCITILERSKPENKNLILDRYLYLIAQCYHHRYDLQHNVSDLTAGVLRYRSLARKYSRSPLADDAMFLCGMLLIDSDPAGAYEQFSKVVKRYPKGDMRPKAAQRMAEMEKALGPERLGIRNTRAKPDSRTEPRKTQQETGSVRPAPKQPVELDRVQHWSVEDYSRVVLYLSGPAAYQQDSVAGDAKKRKPGRIRIKIDNCRLDPKLKHNRISDTFLEQIHASQSSPTSVQVVLSTKAVDTYRIFSMEDPFRLIIDVRGKKPAQPTQSPPAPQKQAPPPESPSSLPSLARQLSLDVKRIVLDPGHGGNDKGATSPWGIHEKDITLALAKALKKVLETRTGCEVILTRTRDKYMSLEERTAAANANKADLFISIHTNAHEDRSLSGVETYFLNLARDKESARVAAFENATSTKKISDLEAILHDLMLNTKINESSRLAAAVQTQIVSKLRTRYDGIRDLGTKQAPFYVLLGAEMPSILIETAFITNQREERRLRDRHFQEYLATAIAGGIESFIRQMKGTARAGAPS